MKLLLIRPKPSPATIGLQHLMIVEPLELEVLAALTGPEDEVRIVDMILEDQPVEHFLLDVRPDLCCVTGYVTNIPTMLAYCRMAKALVPGVVTVAGGVHIEKFPEDIDDPAVDFRVVRNATRTFPQLLDHLKTGAPRPPAALRPGERLEESRLPDFDFFFPRPRRELTRQYRDRYFYVFHDRVALMKTSFGCPYTCNFCYCRRITNDHYYARPLEEVIDELLAIREKEIYIVDDDFLLSPTRIRRFLDLLREKGIRKKYLVYGRADFIVAHPELIREFRDLGLRTIIVGLESFSDAELDGFDKRTTRHINEQAMAILNRYRVDCYAAVITSPDWTEADFQRAGDKLLDLGVKFVNLQPLTPLKGTGIEVDDADLVVPRTAYDQWDLAHVVIRPQHMSVRRYYENLLQLYERIVFRPRNILDHLLHQPLSMQWKMARGMARVRRQYRKRIHEAADYAENPVHTTHAV